MLNFEVYYYLFTYALYIVENFGLLKLSFMFCRFKVHVIVMDETGSTTFVLFDKIVTQFIGRTVQDLIDVILSNQLTCTCILR